MNYPTDPRQRDRWILARRSSPNQLDPRKPYAFLVEEERSASGPIVSTATLFLTNRQCPWHCVFCDLWKNTLSTRVPLGAIPEQIRFALAQLPPAKQIKLYNSGSFFDPGAIPTEDYAGIAQLVRPFERVIVESHPAFLSAKPPLTPSFSPSEGESAALSHGLSSYDNCLRFRDLLSGELEVAIGLETAHPPTLEKLNKNMTLDQFSRAAEFLSQKQISLRTFILVNPPFIEKAEALDSVQRSVQFAFDCGSAVVCLIPARPGNGALDALAQEGLFTAPTMCDLELGAESALALNRGCVLSDIWNLDQFSSCPHCFASREARLQRMNFTQKVEPRENCRFCGT